MKNNIDKSSLHFNRSCKYYRQKKYAEALQELKKALQFGYDPGTIHRDIGMIYFERKRYADAINELKLALKINPEDSEINIIRGRIYEQQGKLKMAEKELKTAERKKSNNISLLKDLGRIYSRQGRYELAVKALKKSIYQGVRSGDAYRELGLAHSKLGKDKLALNELEHALKLNPEDGETYAIIGRIYSGQKEYILAESAYKTALRTGYDPDIALIDLAGIYEQNNEYEKAIKILKNALNKNSNNGHIHAKLAKIYTKIKDGDKAKKELESAVKNDYKDDNIHIQLGRIYRNNGNKEKSINEFKLAGKLSDKKSEKWFKNMILNEIEITEGRIVLKSKPRSLAVCLTNRCNLNCIMCNSIKEKTADLSRKIIDDVVKLFPYLEYITWLGGESFIYPRFEELFDKASFYPHLKQCIVTNGLLINDKWAKKIVSSNTVLVFSIDSIKKSVYEKIRVGAKFDKLIKKLNLINKYRKKIPESRLSLVMQVVLMEENYREITQFPDFMKKHGFDTIQLIPLLDSINAQDSFYLKEKNKDFISKSLADLYDEANNSGITVISGLPVLPASSIHIGKNIKSLKNQKSKQKKIQKDNHQKCLLPWQFINIRETGFVTSYCFCPGYDIDDINKKSIMGVWNGKKYQRLRELILLNKHSEVCNRACIEGTISKEVLQID